MLGTHDSDGANELRRVVRDTGTDLAPSISPRLSRAATPPSVNSPSKRFVHRASGYLPLYALDPTNMACSQRETTLIKNELHPRVLKDQGKVLKFHPTYMS